MRQVVIASLAALFAMVTLSASAQAPAQSDPKPAAAMDYLEASNAKEHVMTMVDAMEQVVLPQIRRQHPNADPAAISALEKAMREEMAASIDDYMVGAAQVYASHFSVQELNALAAFARSDVGRKYSTEMPVITKEVLPLAQAWGRAAAAKAIKSASERATQNGLNL